MNAKEIWKFINFYNGHFFKLLITDQSLKVSLNFPNSSLKTLSTSLFQSNHLLVSQKDPSELRLLVDTPFGVFKQLGDSLDGIFGQHLDFLGQLFLDQQSKSLDDIPQSNFFDFVENDSDEFDLVKEETEFPGLEDELPTSKWYRFEFFPNIGKEVGSSLLPWEHPRDPTDLNSPDAIIQTDWMLSKSSLRAPILALKTLLLTPFPVPVLSLHIYWHSTARVLGTH